MMSDYDTLSAMNTTPLEFRALKRKTAKRRMFRLYQYDRYLLKALALLLFPRKRDGMSETLRFLINEEAKRQGITIEMARQVVRNVAPEMIEDDEDIDDEC